MDNTADTAQVIIRPPLAWGLAVIAGLTLNWLVPLPFLPADLPAGWPLRGLAQRRELFAPTLDTQNLTQKPTSA